MPVPLAYSWRNLRTRWLTTLLTAGGMALVVFVFTATLMLAEGLRRTLVTTGSPGNAIVLRKGSDTEIKSSIERPTASAMATQPEIAFDGQGRTMVARETVVLIGLPKKSTGKVANVTIRGTDAASLELRPQVRLIAGRLPRPGTPEVMVGKAVASGFTGAGLGQSLHFGKREWPVVGVFDAGTTGFSSEIWGDANQLMPAFGRNAYSTVVAGLRDPALFAAYRQAIETDPRLQAETWRETRYYEKQSDRMRKFLTVLGVTLTVIFSLGAVIGATITMYSAVANRVPEIGTLRAIGFRRGAILTAFLLESLFLGLLGGISGVALASCLSFLTFSTTNFQTFSELSFKFTLTPWITGLSLAFAAIMGVAGGFFPAVRAARLNIVAALRDD
ncbi:MAG: ABC transporter permease [Desulfovibrionaceae bacterium]|uniref:ABC transporter permease n=1 Tax=Solidesulfovibrio sp. C21 TaxID=3398613 RepID=UPI0039FDAEE4